MSPEEHYREAERLLSLGSGGVNPAVQQLLARAQVHATLATAQGPREPAVGRLRTVPESADYQGPYGSGSQDR
jgi:hypothetical protein